MRIFCTLILIICLSGCRDKDGLPNGILKKDKMQSVLWDVIHAESYTTQFIKKDSLKNSFVVNAKLQQDIFALHKISKTEFYDSYDYYKNHIELMRVLLDSITASGEREKYKVLYNQTVVPILISTPNNVLPPLLPNPFIAPVLIPMPIPTITPKTENKK